MTHDSNNQTPLAAIILAAGKGTRMQSDLPKVLHPVSNKPMVQWVVDAVAEAGITRTILVVGHGADEVKATIPHCEFVLQDPQLGTGHAVDVCREALQDFEGNIVILGGDGPLIRSHTITEMIKVQETTNASATLATSVIPDPTGYGRIVRDANDRFLAIIEHKNANRKQLAIHEVYPSYAIFNSASLWSCLDHLERNPVSNEYYLTEVPSMMLDKNEKVELINSVPPEDILSINTPEQLAEVEAFLNARLQAKLESTHEPR
ncbi:MAG: NTP transferase domain-containing protein [Phycisphaerales bacterium]|jgi:UDP-N-acetylglucosamine diphosphorylase/glucosamine-1-phosphate N-acetyltransferase|nr:NTP transferase domain-containing protein [Phycisphaerales bacterium]